MNRSDEWLTTHEIASMLKTHDQTVRRWLRAGDLHGVLIADKAGYRVRLKDLEAFLRAKGWPGPHNGAGPETRVPAATAEGDR